MPNFQHDLFISYAHIDNQPLGGRPTGWVADLHHALRVRLGQLLGEEPKIWRDEKLGGADFFDDEIRSALTSAATMLAILSPRYIRSDYCRLELGEFLASVEQQGGIRIGNKSRLLKAVKTPVTLAEHPEAIRGMLGFDFFELANNGIVHEFNDLYGQDWGRKFWQKLEDLAQDLRQILHATRTAGTDNLSAPATGLTLYLGQTTHELSPQRDLIRRELQQRGHRVLPAQPPPLTGDEAEAQIVAALAHSQLAIHLLGNSYGMVPEAAQRSIQEIENRLAAERSRTASLPRLLWLPPGTSPSDSRQSAFIESLRNDSALQAGADLLETPIEELKAVLLNRLAQLQKPATPSSAPANDGGLTRIYLIYDERDEESIAPLEKYLWGADERIEIVRPLFQGDPSVVREEHEENLRICQAALFYFGRGDEAWLRTKLRDLRKAPGLGRQLPLTTSGIYLAPPLDPRKQRYFTREVDQIIRQVNGFEPTLLADFVTKLRLTPNSGKGGQA